MHMHNVLGRRLVSCGGFILIGLHEYVRPDNSGVKCGTGVRED